MLTHLGDFQFVSKTDQNVSGMKSETIHTEKYPKVYALTEVDGRSL